MDPRKMLALGDFMDWPQFWVGFAVVVTFCALLIALLIRTWNSSEFETQDRIALTVVLLTLGPIFWFIAYAFRASWAAGRWKGVIAEGRGTSLTGVAVAVKRQPAKTAGFVVLGVVVVLTFVPLALAAVDLVIGSLFRLVFAG